MLYPSPEPNPAIHWLADLDQAAQLAPNEREDETANVLRAFDEALIADDRSEILAQCDRAVVFFARYKRWRAGMQMARRVYDVVRVWQDFDSSAYSRARAQFTFNYALEFQQAHLLGPAEDLLREAFRLFDECGDAVGVIASEHQLGRVLQERGESWRAEQYFQSSLRRARCADDRKHICHNFFQLGLLAQLEGDVETSVDWFNQALALAEEMNDDLVAIVAFHQLGMVEQTRGNYAAAANHFHAALARAERTNDARGAANALHQLGMLAQAQGELANAEKLYRASLTHSTKLSDLAEQAPTLYQLAHCAWIRGEDATAENLCQQSLTLVQEQGDLEALGRVRRLLGLIQLSITN